MKTSVLPFLAAIAFAAPLHAEPVPPAMHGEAMHAEAMIDGAAMQQAMSDGVVRKIDAGAGKITLRHGPIANLDMPPMTMVFRVQRAELLDAVKVGDAVKFRAEEIDGALTVTAIEAAR